MSLKILILPIFIILELVIAIGYIKPNIDMILTKRDEITVAKESLAKVDAVIENIQSVGQSLRSRSETVSFINKYYPKALDEERVVDMFNYLAQQSGIIATDVIITQTPPVNVADSVYNGAVNSGLTPEEATMKATAAALAAPREYIAKVVVIGAYPNLKDFFNRIYHSDRLHAVQKFSITYRKRDPNKIEEETAKGILDNFLIGSLEAKFPYVGDQRVSDALNDPLFQSPTFDFKTAEQAVSFVTSPLPLLETGETGHTNPYE
jgi:hypothetical protein